MKKCIALHVNDADNVAIVMDENVSAGDIVIVRDRAGRCAEFFAGETIPFGHKMAICDIKKGDHIIKYGEVIGGATRDIATAEYVHVHNMDSLRARGDLETR